MGATDDLLKRSGTPAKPTAPKKGSTPAKLPKGMSATEALLKGGAPKPADDRPKGLRAAFELVKNFVPATIRLAGGVVQEVAGRNTLASGTSVGGAPAALRKDDRSLEERFPITTDIAKSTLRTVKTANPQDLLVDIPTGNFGQTALGKRVKDEGVLGTALATAGDVSMFAGGIGAVGKLAGAGRLAKIGELETIAKAADKVGDAAHAAATRAKIQELRAQGPISAAERITSGAEKVKSLGANVASTPAKPYEYLGRGIAKVSRGTVKLAEKFAPEAVDGLRATLIGTAKKAGVDKTSMGFRALHSMEYQRKAQAEKFRIHSAASEAIRALRGADDEAALTLIRSEELYNMLSAPEFGDVVHVLDDSGLLSKYVEGAFPEGDVSPAAFRTAIEYATDSMSPARAAAFDKALVAVRKGIYDPAEAAMVAGKGTSKPLSPAALANREAQMGNEHLPLSLAKEVEKRQAPIVRREAKAQARFEKKQERTAEAGPQTTKNQERRIAAAAERAKRATAREAAEAKRASRTASRSDARVSRAKERGEARMGEVVGKGREKLEEAGQLARGEARRNKQNAAKALRLRKQVSATEAGAAALRAESLAAKGERVTPKTVRANAAEGSALMKQAAADEAAKLGELKAPRTPAQVRRGISRSAKAAEARTATDTKVARAVQAEADRAAGSALSRAKTEAKNTAKQAEDVAAKVAESAKQRLDRTLANQAKGREAHRARNREALSAAAELAEHEITTFPARFRPAAHTARNSVKALTDLAEQAEAAAPGSGALFARVIEDTPQTLKAMVDAGVDPGFLFGGKEHGSLGAGSSGAVAPTRLRGVTRTASERLKDTNVMPRSVAGQAKKAADEAVKVVRNEFVRTASDFMRDSAVLVSGRDLGVADRYSGLKGEKLAAAMEGEGFVPWDAQAGRRLNAKDATADGQWVDAEFYANFENYFSPKKRGGAAKLGIDVYDGLTSKWKSATLALSPRWHSGNIMGNAVLAMVGGGLTPAQIAKYGVQARRMVQSGEMPAELAARGGAYFDELLPLLERDKQGRLSAKVAGSKIGGTKLGQRLAEPIKSSYAMNEYVDNVNKTMIYLAKKAKGLDEATAVNLALRAAGDFANMSGFERNVVRRIIPFYAWQKHITKLAFRLPLEHPARVAWTLHLADMGNRFTPDPGAGNPFNEGTIPVGGGRLSVRGLGPLGSSFFVDPTLRGAGYQLNPVLKLGVLAATGRDLNTGGEAVTRPGTKFGDKPVGGLALSHFGDFAQVAAQTIPQTKTIQDLIAGQAPVRYATGEPREGKMTGRDRGDTLARFLGIPLPEKEQKPRKPIKK